jgi:ABC-type phosphate/phosphonate transport system substrate-binding protein
MSSIGEYVDMNDSGTLLRRRTTAVILLGAMMLAIGGGPLGSPAKAVAAEPPLTVVVMDPLALPLACACVKGYAQRRYDHLAVFLEKRLGREVSVIFSEDLAKAVRGSARPVDVVIGKDSVVRFDAAECKLPVRPLARLTGKEGTTTLTGLFVVPAGDRAKKITDLDGYRIVFGPEDSAEKHSAAVAALEKAGVPVPEKRETAPSCTEAAYAALEHEASPGAAAVISSYAKVLMEGCGSIDPGALRIVGRTDPVPFVTVFVAESVSADAQQSLLDALLAVRESAQLLAAVESKQGFVKVAADPPAASAPNPPAD